MPFDPTLPTTNSNGSSAQMREQFNSMKAMIDALTATVASQATQLAAHDIAISQRLKSSDAVNFFAANVNIVVGDITTFDDPPTQAQIEALRDKLNELINTLHT